MELQDLHPDPSIAALQVIGMIISDNITILVILAIAYIFRNSIEDLIKRIWKLVLKIPDGTTVSIEAEPQEIFDKGSVNISAVESLDSRNDENILLEKEGDILGKGESEGDGDDENEPLTVRNLFEALYQNKSKEADEIYEKLISTNENENELIEIKGLYLYGLKEIIT